MRHTRLMSAALVVVAAGAAACSGTDTVVTPDISDSSSIQATFALDSVNARALPVEMRHDATGSMSVTRGRRPRRDDERERQLARAARSHA